MSEPASHLDSNLAALRERCPAFLAWWRERPSQPGESRLILSLSGLPDLEVERPGGRRIILYNRENPLEAVQSQMDGQTFPKGSLTFLFGLGLGYRVLHILRTMEPGHAVYVVERDPDVLRWALALHDYSAHIRGGEMVFAVPEAEALRTLIRERSGALLSGHIRLFLEECAQSLDRKTGLLHDACLRQVNAIRVNFNTAVQLGGTLIQNEILNLPKTLLGWSPEGLLSGAFRNRPAIIVATGPSLQKNISFLRKARGRALVIAVAQALRVLLAYDIRPDILCSIDFGEYNYRELADAIGEADMPLLIHPQVYPRVPVAYQGDLFVAPDRHSLLVPPGGSAPSPLGHALTVAQTALNLALAAGADPIVFTGQDLAFGETSHVEGALARGRVTVNGNCVVMKGKQTDNVQEACWVPGYFGGRVLTNAVLYAFLEEIEATVRRHPDRRFINATEGGARIAGTERMALRDVLESRCRDEFPVADFLAAARRPLGTDTGRLCRELEDARKHLERLLDRVGDLERMTGEMKALLAGGAGTASPQQRKKRLALTRRMLDSFTSILTALDANRPIRLATAKIKHLLVRIGGRPEAQKSARESPEQVIRYCEEMSVGLKEICPPLLEKIRSVHPLLREYATLAEDLRIVPPGGNAEASLRLRLGSCLRRMGHLEKADLELERAQQAGDPGGAALEERIALNLDRKRFGEAGRCLEALPDGHPGKERFLAPLLESGRRDRGLEIEKARHCLETDDFVGCLLACRRLRIRHGEDAEVKTLRERALAIRERRIASALDQSRREQERQRALEEREARLQEARRGMEERDYAAALALFREMAEADRGDLEARLGVVRALEGLQNWEDAERELRKVAERNPEHGLLHRDLGNLLLRRGNFGEALENYQKAANLDTGANGLCGEIASILSSAGRTAEALPFFERHLKTHANDYRTIVLWADCFLRLGSGPAAKMGYEAALRVRRDYAPALERLKILEQARSS